MYSSVRCVSRKHKRPHADLNQGVSGVSNVDIKWFSLGILLLVGGVLIAYVEFGYPEYFFGWFGLGLAGPLVWGLFLVLIFLGIGFVYGSFGKEEVTLAPPTAFLLDERIDIEGKQYVTKEISLCKRHLDSKEKILAIITGYVEGNSTLDRLALTDRRIVFYSRDDFQKAMVFDYEEIDSVEGKKGRFFTHLGEIKLCTRRETISFKNALEEYVDRIVDILSGMRSQIR